jgi:hypothetical protein
MSSTKACGSSKRVPGVESSDLEEFSVALDAPIYPPRPNLLAFSPASDFHSGHAGRFRCIRLEVCLLLKSISSALCRCSPFPRQRP